MLIYFLPTILALGIVTSYEDIMEGKIRNKYLIAASAAGLAIQAVLMVARITTWKYLLVSASYALATLLIGFLLWYFGWWNAGDAKLLAVFVFLTPIHTYQYQTTQLPFLEIGFNALIPIFSYLLITLITRTKTQKKIDAIKKTFEPKRVIGAVIIIFSISWPTNYIFNYAGIQSNIIINILLIAVIYKLLQKALRDNTFPFLVIVCILRIFLNTGYFISKSFAISFILMVLLYIILMGFVRFLAEHYSKEISIPRLETGMILSEGILRTGFKAPLRKFKKEQYVLTKTTPLTEDDLKKIRQWHEKGKIHFNKIGVNQTIVFAPHIFIGTLMTIICQGNLIMFLRATFSI